MKKFFATAASLLFATSVAFAQDDNWDATQYAEDVSDNPEATAEIQESAPAESQEPTEVSQSTEEKAPAKEITDVPVSVQSEESVQEDYTAPAKKESRLGVGIKVAFDYGSIYGFEEEDDDVDGNPSGFGFDAGLMFKLQLVDNFAFAPEINFAYMKTSHDYLKAERSYTRMDLEIPLLVRGSVSRFYVTFGPQFNLNLGDKTKISGSKYELVEQIEQSFMDFGIAAGAGVNIADKLYFDIRCYMGLTELFPDVTYIGDPDVDMTKNWSMIDMAGAKTLKFKAGISYWFI